MAKQSWETRWKITSELGRGGQGIVSRVVSADRENARQKSIEQIIQSIELAASQVRDQEKWSQVLESAQRLAEAIHTLTRADTPSEIGALKVLSLPDGMERHEAEKRFAAELQALGALSNQPGILKLLDGDPAECWMVTKLYPRTLEGTRLNCVGDGLVALRRFRPLVAAVAELHKRGLVHRDIKPANIFIDDAGVLILGDFGIVFWMDDSHERLTETFERVGTRDWMAPWAHTGRRFDDVKPSLDVFPLAKVLWHMISGQKVLPFWRWDRADYNLEHLFPDDAAAFWINRNIFKEVIVENERDCLPNAAALLARVDSIIRLVERGGQRLGVGIPIPCRVCGVGAYDDFRGGESSVIAIVHPRNVQSLTQMPALYSDRETKMTVRAKVCNTCGHFEFFHFPDGRRASWES